MAIGAILGTAAAAAAPYLLNAGGHALGSWLGSSSGSNRGQSAPSQPNQGWSFFNQPTQQYSPQQQQLQNQSVQQILSLLQGGPQQQAKGFEPFAQQARQQFQTQTIPSIAERFTAMGGSGTRQNSSAFQGVLGSAGANLESQLAGLGSQYGQQQYNNQFNQLFGLATSPQFSNYTTREPGFGENALVGASPVLALLAALYGGNKLNQYFNPTGGA